MTIHRSLEWKAWKYVKPALREPAPDWELRLHLVIPGIEMALERWRGAPGRGAPLDLIAEAFRFKGKP